MIRTGSRPEAVRRHRVQVHTGLEELKRHRCIRLLNHHNLRTLQRKLVVVVQLCAHRRSLRLQNHVNHSSTFIKRLRQFLVCRLLPLQ